MEKTGREGLRLERVLSTTNDASLGLRIFQAEGKGRGLLVSIFIQSCFDPFCLSFCCYTVFPQTTRRFVKGEPVVEYKGTLLSYGEARVGSRLLNYCKGPVVVSKVINYCLTGKAGERRRCHLHVL